MLPQVRLQWLPRMADFALWVAACETGFRPEVAFAAAYSNNRRDAIENIVEADPVAARMREIMADRAQWAGSASDLLLAGANVAGNPMVGTLPAGQRTPALSLVACAGYRPCSVRSALRLSSAARGGRECGRSG
jgi:hypothetical protein